MTTAQANAKDAADKDLDSQRVLMEQIKKNMPQMVFQPKSQNSNLSASLKLAVLFAGVLITYKLSKKSPICGSPFGPLIWESSHVAGPSGGCISVDELRSGPQHNLVGDVLNLGCPRHQNQNVRPQIWETQGFETIPNVCSGWDGHPDVIENALRLRYRCHRSCCGHIFSNGQAPVGPKKWDPEVVRSKNYGIPYYVSSLGASLQGSLAVLVTCTWLVVKTMIPVWVLSVIQHLVVRGPKRGQ